MASNARVIKAEELTPAQTQMLKWFADDKENPCGKSGSTVSQLRPPFADRIKEEHLSGLCDALCIEFLARQAKHQPWPATNEGFAQEDLDRLVTYQRDNQGHQQNGAVHALEGVHLRSVDVPVNGKHQIRADSGSVSIGAPKVLLRSAKRCFEGVVSESIKLIEKINEHNPKEEDVARRTKEITAELPLFAMFYFRNENQHGNHNCCAVFKPNGAIDYYDPNLGVRHFEQTPLPANVENAEKANVQEFGNVLQTTASKMQYGTTLDTAFFFDERELLSHTLDPL